MSHHDGCSVILQCASFLTLLSSSLSIFGSCLIILTFILWKDVRKSTARIILLFLAIADLGTGISFFTSSVGYITYLNHDGTQQELDNSSSYGNFCTTMSFFTTFFPVSSFFWTAYLALYFVIALVLKKPRWSKRLVIIYNLTAWTIPFVICVVAISLGILGKSASRTSGGWCFVEYNGTGKYNNYSYSTYLLLEAVCGKGWELLFYAVVIFCYSTIYCVNRKCCRINRKVGQNSYPPLIDKESDSYVRISHKASSHAALSNAISKKLFIIPIVFIFLRAPGTYRYILSMFPCCNPESSLYDRNNTKCGVSEECFKFGGNYYFLVLQAFCDPLQGFGNALLFVLFSRVIMRRLFYLLHKKLSYCYKFCNKSQSISSMAATTDVNPAASLRAKNSPGVKRQEQNVEYDTQLDDEYTTSISSASTHLQYGAVTPEFTNSMINA